MDSTTVTPATPTDPPLTLAEDDRRRARDNALTKVRACITVLDDEAIIDLDWERRDELIVSLREAVKELRRL